ncbi:hypothetical protein DPM19_25305 [Actinomadura craniellae]|uniref:HEAT repeat domain-containing protein n=1 Tax=Actinomadura craniellae TaxID=2231787 RepID=A0A365H060_9ACTN|nr:HEAT repeat domain-containing protein [Actinomadura craniellae]RAY12460.1 hypothetical protein DPM19_25305 [Actinomadura craniellae]
MTIAPPDSAHPAHPAHLDPADLEERLRHPDPAIRRSAVALVAATAPRAGGNALAWALADPDPGVRSLAADALAAAPDLYIGEDGIKALLLAAVQGRDSQVRRTAADLLDTLTEGTRELYTRGLEDGEPHQRMQAVRGLVALRAVALVGEAADDPSRDVRVAVADGLSRLALPAGLPALEQLLADRDPVVRLAALDATVELGLPESLTGRVVTAIAHPSWQVRKRAAAALAGASPEVAVQPLILALRDRIVDVRRTAVLSLEQWAADHPEVVTALTEALADPDPGVRTQVRWALA